MILRLAELLILVLGTWFVLTQVIIPAFSGTRLFPFFLGDRKTLAEKKEALKEKIDLCKEEIELADLHRQLTDLETKKDQKSNTGQSK